MSFEAGSLWIAVRRRGLPSLCLMVCPFHDGADRRLPTSSLHIQPSLRGRLLDHLARSHNRLRLRLELFVASLITAG